MLSVYKAGNKYTLQLQSAHFSEATNNRENQKQTKHRTFVAVFVTALIISDAAGGSTADSCRDDITDNSESPDCPSIHFNT